MAITAKDVQALREITGAGMMDCKRALVDSDGDVEKAILILREKGLAAAAKKAGRIAAEGMVYAEVDGCVGVIVEVNSETDFVAKNADFQKFVKDIAGVIAAKAPADLEALIKQQYPGGALTVEQAQQEKVLTIGENIRIRRFERYDTGFSVAYVHMGGKIGVLVNLAVSDNIKDNEKVLELGKDIAMQIAAMKPLWLDSSAVDPAELQKEREVLTAQALNEGKPAAVAEKMVAGRINKYYQEFCLVDQPFVKENKISVGKHVAEVAKQLGGSIAITKFTRFEKGEGLAKREDDFASEVANMIK